MVQENRSVEIGVRGDSEGVMRTKEKGKRKEMLKKRDDCNITPRLHPKLWRRITYEQCESEVDVRGDRGTGNVADGNVVVFEVFQRRTRARRGAGAGVATADTRVLGDHSLRMGRRDRTRLGGGGRGGGGRARTRVAQGAAPLRMAGAIDLANRTNVPLAMDVDMSKMVTFEAQFMVARVVMGEWGIDGYAMDSPSSIDFMTKFYVLEGQLNLGGERRGGSGWKRLGVGRCSQFFDVSL